MNPTKPMNPMNLMNPTKPMKPMNQSASRDSEYLMQERRHTK